MEVVEAGEESNERPGSPSFFSFHSFFDLVSFSLPLESAAEFEVLRCK